LVFQPSPAPEQRPITRWRTRRVACYLALGATLAAAGGLLALPGGPSSGAARSSKSHPKTFLGPDGIESAAMIAQNKLPGTTSWEISGHQSPGFIEGFAGLNYAEIGDRVGLYVSTSARSFRVTAYRMGYYDGKGGHEVWRSDSIAGRVQPSCRFTSGINMVSCANWHRSLVMTVTRAFFQGDYLLKLVGSGNQQAYVLLTVWNPSSTAAYLFMSRSLTEQGWNTFGGYSFYQGEGPCAPSVPVYPVCNRARVVSFDRPYAEGDGASDFLSNEYPLIRLMEEDGLDVAYCTDITVDEHPQILLDHKALLSPGHDETWTYPELHGAQVALAHGVNIAFMSAAAIVRHARLQPSPLGPDREEVDYRDADEDPLNGRASPNEVTGNTWASPPTDWNSTPFIGELYSGYLLPGAAPTPFVVEDAKAWIFKDTGLHNGSVLPRVIDSDIDHIDIAYGTPANIEVLGHSPVPLNVSYTNQGEWNGDTYSDMTYYTDPTSKAGVFDSGDVNWIDAMLPCPKGVPVCPDRTVQKITENLLWLFGQGPAGSRMPSRPNWKSVSPAGS
jgi:hypothetical protein